MRVIDQIAFRGGRTEMNRHKNMGHTEWIIDIVTAEGYVWKQVPHKKLITNVACLRFNYTLIPGKEFELLEYESGPNWHNPIIADRMDGLFFCSHMGTHVEEMPIMSDLYPIIQEVVTIGHSNLNINPERRWHYRIHDTRADLGYDTKFIRRIKTEEVASVLEDIEKRHFS